MAEAVHGSNGISGIQRIDHNSRRLLFAINDHKHLHPDDLNLYVFEDQGTDDWTYLGGVEIRGPQGGDVEDITYNGTAVGVWFNGRDQIGWVEPQEILDKVPGGSVNFLVEQVTGEPGNVESIAYDNNSIVMIERGGGNVGQKLRIGTWTTSWTEWPKMEGWVPGPAMVSGIGAADIWQDWLFCAGVGKGPPPNWSLSLFKRKSDGTFGPAPTVWKASAGRTSEGACFDTPSIGYPRFVYHNAEGNPGTYGKLYRTELIWE
jgi:hypothetical protein